MIIKTIIAAGPIVFLKLSENKSGSYDAIITASGQKIKHFDEFHPKNAGFLNYTQIVDLFEDDPIRVSPRKQWCSSFYAPKGSTTETASCIMLMDTEREAEINLGENYPFGPLSTG